MGSTVAIKRVQQAPLETVLRILEYSTLQGETESLQIIIL